MCAGSSFDDLIRTNQQRLRNRQAERLRRLQVDDEFELRGLLDGKVGGLGALEDLIDEVCGAPPQVSDIDPVRHEPASIYELPIPIHRRQPALGRKVRDTSSVSGGERIPQHDKGVRALRLDSRERGVEIIESSQLQGLKYHLQCSGSNLHVSEQEYVLTDT